MIMLEPDFRRSTPNAVPHEQNAAPYTVVGIVQRYFGWQTAPSRMMGDRWSAVFSNGNRGEDLQRTSLRAEALERSMNRDVAVDSRREKGARQKECGSGEARVHDIRGCLWQRTPYSSHGGSRGTYLSNPSL